MELEREEELDDELVAALDEDPVAALDPLEEEPGMVSCWPMMMSARELRLLADTIAWTVVPDRAAMALTVSPAWTR